MAYTHRQRVRLRAHITQTEAAVRAGVSPTLARAYERHGAAAVIDPERLARLEAVYRQLEIEAQRRTAA